MAEPAAKKPRRSLLPDLESMESQRSADKQAIMRLSVIFPTPTLPGKGGANDGI